MSRQNILNAMEEQYSSKVTFRPSALCGDGITVPSPKSDFSFEFMFCPFSNYDVCARYSKHIRLCVVGGVCVANRRKTLPTITHVMSEPSIQPDFMLYNWHHSRDINNKKKTTKIVFTINELLKNKEQFDHRHIWTFPWTERLKDRCFSV